MQYNFVQFKLQLLSTCNTSNIAVDFGRPGRSCDPCWFRIDIDIKTEKVTIENCVINMSLGTELPKEQKLWTFDIREDRIDLWCNGERRLSFHHTASQDPHCFEIWSGFFFRQEQNQEKQERSVRLAGEDAKYLKYRNKPEGKCSENFIPNHDGIRLGKFNVISHP